MTHNPDSDTDSLRYDSISSRSQLPPQWLQQAPHLVHLLTSYDHETVPACQHCLQFCCGACGVLEEIPRSNSLNYAGQSDRDEVCLVERVVSMLIL